MNSKYTFRRRLKPIVALMLVLSMMLGIVPAYAVSSIDEEMAANSAAWWVAKENGDTEMMQELADRNAELREEKSNAGYDVSYNPSTGETTITDPDDSDYSYTTRAEDFDTAEEVYTEDAFDAYKDAGSFLGRDESDMNNEIVDSYNNRGTNATNDRNYTDERSSSAEVAIIKEVTGMSDEQALNMKNSIDEQKNKYMDAQKEYQNKLANGADPNSAEMKALKQDMADAHAAAQTIRGQHGYTGDGQTQGAIDNNGGYIYYPSSGGNSNNNYSPSDPDDYDYDSYYYDPIPGIPPSPYEPSPTPKNSYTIKASAGVGGSISPGGNITVDEGETQTFYFTPYQGYSVQSVVVDGVNTGAPSSYTFRNVTSAHTIRVIFVSNGGSQSNTPLPKTYHIFASAGTGGKISPSGTITLAAGESQSFTITPNSGYRIKDVIVDGVSQGAVSSHAFYNVNSAHTITATFMAESSTPDREQYTFEIFASAGTGGRISPAGTILVGRGQSQSFTITPYTGYQIASVIVDGVNQGILTSYTFQNVTSTHSIVASFTPDHSGSTPEPELKNTYTITASATTGGSISPSGTLMIDEGESQSFAITANPGYTILSVLVDGVNQGVMSSYTFHNVNSAHTIRATFIEDAFTPDIFDFDTFNITIQVGNGGSASCNGTTIRGGTSETISVSGGSTQNISITPNSRYYISSVKVNGVSYNPSRTLRLNNIYSDYRVVIYFEDAYGNTIPVVNTHNITASAGAGGSISPSGTVAVTEGLSKTFTITPNYGYRIHSVLVDGVDQGAVSSYTFSDVTRAHTIKALFTLNTYSITASAGAGGSITPSGSISVVHGGSQTYQMIPAFGYKIASVVVDGVNQGSVSSYTFSNVAGGHSISASFERI